MGESFEQILRATCIKKKSLVCVGLDPDPDKFPDGIPKNAEGIFLFCREIINSVSGFAAAFKPNLAFFEAFGSEGIKALEKTMDIMPRDLLTIGDAKRSDIGNTSKKYAEALFNKWGFSAATVNPYLGKDSLEPFLSFENKGVFVLCLTSNKGAFDFQTPDKMYIKVAQAVFEMNKNRNCGLVTGATHPEYLSEIRSAAGDMPFLIPGVGAQGGDLRQTLIHAADNKGVGFIINASRTIIYASSGKNFAEAAAINAKAMRDEINSILTETNK